MGLEEMRRKNVRIMKLNKKERCDIDEQQQQHILEECHHSNTFERVIHRRSIRMEAKTAVLQEQENQIKLNLKNNNSDINAIAARYLLIIACVLWKRTIVG